MHKILKALKNVEIMILKTITLVLKIWDVMVCLWDKGGGVSNMESCERRHAGKGEVGSVRVEVVAGGGGVVQHTIYQWRV